MKRIALLLTLLVLAGCGGDDDDRAASPLETATDIRETVDSDGITTPLTELNDSGQTGEVTLTPAGEGKTFVVVRVDKPGSEELETALRSGSCAQPGAVVAELEAVGERPAETTVEQSLDSLLAEPHSVTVGAGPDACADVAGPAE